MATGGSGIPSIISFNPVRGLPNTSNNTEVARPRSIFVANLNRDTNEHAIRTYFKDFGPVRKVSLVRNYYTRVSKGFAFVTFKHPFSVRRVLDQTVHYLDDKHIDVKLAVSKNITCKLKIFVGGIDNNTTFEELRTYFSQYGAVLDVTIPLEYDSNRRRGFAYVRFKDEATAIQVCSSRFHSIGSSTVECKPCTSMCHEVANVCTNVHAVNYSYVPHQVAQGSLSWGPYFYSHQQPRMPIEIWPAYPQHPQPYYVQQPFDSSHNTLYYPYESM